jgi:molecular chaperone DnaK (HSP70)
MALYCGLDFGTSNSVITVLRDGGNEASFSSVREPSL